MSTIAEKGGHLRQLRKWLTDRLEWFETALDELARLDGYGDLSKPMVQLCAQIGREPVRIMDIARRLGTSRQWVIRLAREGERRGILLLTDDPDDRRAMRVGFSETGWSVVRLAVIRMNQIEDELAARIGRERLDQLIDILSADWGEPRVTKAGDDDS